MKRILFILTVLATTLSLTAEELPDYLVDLQDDYDGRLKVWELKDDDIEDRKGNDVFVIQFKTRQDIRDEGKENYQLCVTVQLTDKKTKMIVFSQSTMTPHPLPPDAPQTRYAGYTEWEFQIPFGKLTRPKLSACTIEFGLTKDSFFVPVATLFEDVDSADEIMKGEGTKVKMKCTVNSKHFIVGNR